MHRLFGWVSGSGEAAPADADNGDESDDKNIDYYEEGADDDIYETDGESVEHDELPVEETDGKAVTEEITNESDGEDQEMDMQEQNEDGSPAEVDDINDGANNDFNDEGADDIYETDRNSLDQDQEIDMQEQNEVGSPPEEEDINDYANDGVNDEGADDIYETDEKSVEQDELAVEENIGITATEGIANEHDVNDDADDDVNDEGDDDIYETDAKSLDQEEFPVEENIGITAAEGISSECDGDNQEMDMQEKNDENDSPPEEEDVNDDAKDQTSSPPNDTISEPEKIAEDHIDNSSLTGETSTSFAETKQTTPPTVNQEVDLDQSDEREDSFPKARDFLVDMNDDCTTLANQATEIVEGFNNDDGENDNPDDAKTIATNRTNATRVQPVSAAFRTAMALKEEAELRKMRHPHQSIFDILDRNFEELGDGSGGNSSGRGGGGGGKKIGFQDVKLCFVAFVTVFSLPSEPVFATDDEDFHLDGKESFDSGNSHQMDADDGNKQRLDGNGEEKFSSQDNQKESILQKVPLSVAFALWRKVLQRLHIVSKEENTHDLLSYIRSTLVLLGMLDLASIERDRDDGVSSSNVQSFGHSNKSIECLVVHDHIHQQYGEYLAWGDHEGAYRSLIEEDGQQWNDAVMNESNQIGSNQYTLRMLPLNTMRANRMQDAFDLLNDKTFVRRRIRVLGASGAAKAHVGDVDELLCLIEKQTMNGDPTSELIDEQECLLGAYQQVLKYCLHETDELSKPHKDDEGNIKLGKTAMYRTADIGNALHLLGASLGGYGFFDKEMEYYNEALRLKKLSVNGDIEKSVSASDTLHSMGFSLDNAGKSDEALECYDQALAIRYACLGDDDLRVAETQHNKGALLCEEDRAEEALECLEEALHIRENHYGEEHESCADTMQWMGNLLRKHGDPSNALDYFKFALSIKQKRLGGDDIDVANTLFNTAVLLDDIEKHDLSLVAYKEALRIRKLVLGEKNQEVADTLFCIGNVATVVENHKEALEFYKESIKIREALIHDDDPSAKELDDTLLFISNPASPRPDLLSQYEKLNQCFEEALPLTKLIMGTNHPDVYDLLNRMGEVYKKLHDWDNAIGSFQGALRVKRADAPEGQDDIEVAALLQKKGEAHLYKN